MHETDSLVATAVDLEAYSSDVSRAFHDPNGDETLVHTVLEALEEASEQPADEMSVRLYDAVDPDALNDVFEPTQGGLSRDVGRVSFTIGEFAVDVHANGHVFVRRRN